MSREEVSAVNSFRPILTSLKTISQLQQLHFDGYALDYVDFPEGMRWFLSCMNLHRTVGIIEIPFFLKLTGAPA